MRDHLIVAIVAMYGLYTAGLALVIEIAEI